MNGNIRFLQARASTVALLLAYRDPIFELPCRFVGWLY